MSRRTMLPLTPFAVVLVAVGTAASERPECSPISGAEGLFQAGTVLLVGEQHGTRESPAFFEQLACRAVGAGLPLVVGLEIFDSEQARVDAFLASSGDGARRAAVLAGDPWRKHQQWGVTSEAMLGLLAGLRDLRQGGGEIRVVLFNRLPAPDSQSRDRAMARYLATALAGMEQAFTLVLTGNVHSRVTKGTHFSRDYQPMGYLLRRALAPRRVVSLDVAHRGGTVWICPVGEPCGSYRQRPRGPDFEAGIRWNESPAESGHDGWYQVGEIAASPPAVGAVEGKYAAPAESAELLWQHDTGG